MDSYTAVLWLQKQGCDFYVFISFLFLPYVVFNLKSVSHVRGKFAAFLEIFI